jgi:hypothetical protein
MIVNNRRIRGDQAVTCRHIFVIAVRERMLGEKQKEYQARGYEIYY